VYNHVDLSQVGPSDQAAAHQLGCLNAATDCASVAACLTVPASKASVCNGGTTPRCSGNVLVDCGSTVGALTEGQDCSAVGLVCVENAEGATCATAACDPNTTKPTCDGNRIVECSQFGGGLVAQGCLFAQSTSCSSSGGCEAQIGETCGLVGGVGTCVGSGPSCDASTFKASCDGTTVVTCAGGQQSRVDCTTLDPGFTCKQMSDGTVTCAGAGTQCTDSTPESCADGVVTFCMLGNKATLDCKSYGLSGCAVNPGSMPAQAHCTP
jgi:hypothetical protein